MDKHFTEIDFKCDFNNNGITGFKAVSKFYDSNVEWYRGIENAYDLYWGDMIEGNDRYMAVVRACGEASFTFTLIAPSKTRREKIVEDAVDVASIILNDGNVSYNSAITFK